MGHVKSNKVKFPRRGEDGSFCVEVCVSLMGAVDDDLASHLQDWINNVWMQRNRAWSFMKETIHYESEFSRPPQIISCANSQLRFRLFGVKSAKYWKDWLVFRLVPDLKVEFPEIEIGSPRYIKNCDD